MNDPKSRLKPRRISYLVVFEQEDDGTFSTYVPELPGCYSQGKTLKELMANIKEAIEVYIESMGELNTKPQNKFVGIKEVVVNA